MEQRPAVAVGHQADDGPLSSTLLSQLVQVMCVSFLQSCTSLTESDPPSIRLTQTGPALLS